jgi:hypothetical protein
VGEIVDIFLVRSKDVNTRNWILHLQVDGCTVKKVLGFSVDTKVICKKKQLNLGLFSFEKYLKYCMAKYMYVQLIM